MEKITAFSSRLVPMLMPNIDTDQIIPAQFVSSRTTAEFAHALFRNRRDREPGFVLNDPAMTGRSIILAGPNFGCGSSREAAPWALVAGGFRAVFSVGFGDIFTNNSLKNGLLPIVLDEGDHASFVDAFTRNSEVEVEVDLPGGVVSIPPEQVEVALRLDPFYRHLLVNGMDELDYLLDHVSEIEKYEASTLLQPTTRARLATAAEIPAGADV
jgi:3-isopropylmalate/(R)-2-methylmalate dehydratase small subunit